jgi:hypothetical protein
MHVYEFNSRHALALRSSHISGQAGVPAGTKHERSLSALSGDSLVTLTLLILLRMIRHQSIVYKLNLHKMIVW